jgi:uncharacterized membrane protein YuzA (DUF378 family)
MKFVKLVDVLAQFLILIGALNWGMIGLYQIDAVKEIFGSFHKYIYITVGVAALYLIVRRLF